MPKDQTVEERFWARVDVSSDLAQCWLWTGSRNRKGYGSLWINGSRIGAHVYAYTRVHGPIKSSMCICHHCDNPSCCNEEHLFLGTYKDNMQDMLAKGRLPDRKGENCNNSKLTWEKVRAIRARANEYDNRFGARVAIGKEFGVSGPQVGRILANKQWAE